MTLTLVLVLFATLAVIGVPIAFSLGIAATVSIYFTTSVPLTIVFERMLLGVDSFLFVAVPLFIMAASIMNRSGVTERIFSFARALVGHFPGALGYSNIMASIVFSGMSGSAVADNASLGKIEVDAMVKQGYPKKFAAAVTCASATIGPIFPPSIPFVIFGGIAGVSVGKLFLAGILPGILIALCLAVLVYYFAVKNDYPRDQQFVLKNVLVQLTRSFLPLLTPIFIIGGIVTGFFTPTEAAAFTVLYACILGFFVYGELKIAMFPDILKETFTTTAAVMLIIAAASAFSWILTMEQVGRVLADWAATAEGPLFFLLLVSLVLFLLGMVMETTALLIIVTPFVVPAAQALDIDMVHFGVVVVLNLMIGLATPPFGLGLFTVSKISNLSIEQLSLGMLPFIPMLLIALLLVILFPSLTLWLPNLLM
jgi:tripartite ATP-independent transporter DctM subunit